MTETKNQNDMYNDYDIQWRLRCRALTDCRNPLSDDRWQSMVAQACASGNQKRDAESGNSEVEKRKRQSSLKLTWRMSAAAVCLILIMIGTFKLHSTEQPTNVKYSGQSVRFICNNQCNAQSTLAYFDSYIGKKGAL